LGDTKKDWYGLTGIGMIYRQSTEKGKITEDTRYFIGSIDNVKQFAKSAREHWGVESVHWNLDYPRSSVIREEMPHSRFCLRCA